MGPLASNTALLLGLTAAFACAPAEPEGPEGREGPDGPKRPNVILFLVDDVGWMDTEPYGSQYYRTPNVQRLADEGMRWTDAYADSTCSPTRASILTGQWSARHGLTEARGHMPALPEGAPLIPDAAPEYLPLRASVSRHALDPGHMTLAEALREAGYRTGHFGKWHLGVAPRHWPQNAGFEVAWHAEPSAAPPGDYFSPYGVLPPAAGDQPAPSSDAPVGTITDGEDGEYITDRLTDEALAFMGAADDRPFFLNLWHYGVHSPWGHKEAYTEAFAGVEDPTGRQGNPVMASMIQSLDESLGRILNALDERGIARDTLVIFYSDNGGNHFSHRPRENWTPQKIAKWRASTEARGGEALARYRKWAGDMTPTSNLPLRGGKGDVYEGGTRVPLIVRWPGRIEAGSVTDAVAGALDLYPTILDAADLQPPQRQVIDGLSILPVLGGSGALEREAYFGWRPQGDMAATVRMGDWKLIRRLRPAPSYPGLDELYRLSDDLGERTNLIAAEPAKARELDLLIDGFLRETGAHYPQPNPHHVAFGLPGVARGIVPDRCVLSFAGGALGIATEGGEPALGLALARPDGQAGPLTCVLEVRSSEAGSGAVTWTTDSQWVPPAEGQEVRFQLTGGSAWQKIVLDLPVQGSISAARITFSEPKGALDVRALRFLVPETGAWVKVWEFGPR